MNKTELGRVIDLLASAKKLTDKIILTPINTGVCFSAVTQHFMTHMIINGDGLERRSTIYTDQLEFIKAHHKGMKSTDDLSPVELVDKYGSSDTHLIPIESNTFTPAQDFKSFFEFEVDYSVLENAYKSLKEKGKPIRIQVDAQAKKALLSNTSGDISLIGLFIS